MRLSRYLPGCLMGLLGATATMPSGYAVPTEQRPRNIVLIVSDDLGYADVGFHGSGDVRTPNLDRLAREGVVSTNAYASAPQCSPTRAAVMTGMYQQRFGYEHIAPAKFKSGLPLDLKIMPAYLKEAGYHTGLVGKWHLGYTEPYQPQRRGFDYFYGFLEGAHHYFESKEGHPPTSQYSPLFTMRGEEPITKYLTEQLADEAVAFIERNRDRPFFLYLPFNAPHHPMEAPPELEASFAHVEDPARRTYLAMIASMDAAIGRVVAQIEANGAAKDTLIIFTNDNGGVSKPAEPSSNSPFRGNKGDILEGGIRVPWITYWPGKLKPGLHHDPICVIDLLPTFLRLASQPLPEGLDGVDIWPSLRGEKLPARDYLYWRFNFRGTPQGAVRKGDWKYYTGVPRSQRAKLKPAEYLYNLREDPGETRNLAAEQPELVDELRTAFQSWSSRLQDPAWPSD